MMTEIAPRAKSIMSIMLLIAEPIVIWLLSPPAPLMPSLTFSFAVVLAAKVLMGDGAAALIDGATAPATTVEQMLALRSIFVKVFMMVVSPLCYRYSISNPTHYTIGKYSDDKTCNCIENGIASSLDRLWVATS